MRAAALLLAVALLAAAALAQDLAPKAPPQSRPVAIVGATVHPASGPPIEDATIQFEDGVIRAIGTGKPELTDRVRIIDGTGKHVYPGLIAAYSQLGLTEIGSVRATRDMDEVGAITPEVRAAVAVNPDSTLIPVARSNGVLTAGIFPQGGAIPGRASVIRLDGWTWEDMAIEADAGLVVAWPSSRPIRRRWMKKSDEEQKEESRRNLTALKETFSRAKAYLAARATDETLPLDLRFEAMRPVLPRGDAGPARPVFFQANDYVQITSALAFAARHGIRPVIVGGRDARLCLDRLRESGAGVIVTGTFAMPKRSDSDYDEVYRLPSRLQAAGIPWCLASGQGASNDRNLPYAAAMAVAHGLDPDAALRAITISAARLLGVGDRVGSLEIGKLATLLVTDGSPFEMTTRIEHAFIDGREIDLGNKQTALDAKYREKYRQLGLLPRKER